MDASIDTSRRTVNKTDQLLSVRIGQQVFALNVMAVRKIGGWIAATPLPHAPSYIKGMISATDDMRQTTPNTASPLPGKVSMI